MSSTDQMANLSSAEYDALGDTIAANGTDTSQISGWQMLYAHNDGTVVTTSTTMTGGGDDPIYNLALDTIADNSAALWDGTLDTAINVDETGGTWNNSVWTGFDATGAATAYPLGGTTCNRGSAGSVDSWWAVFGDSPTLSCGWSSGNVRAYIISPLLEAPVIPYSLTVTKDGQRTGTVTSNPAGIDCGSTCSADFEV